jgi:hypothetical protein
MDSYINGIPRIFAIMDDQPRAAYSASPVHERRYNIYLLDPDEGGLFHFPCPNRYVLKEYKPHRVDFKPDGTIPLEFEAQPWRPGRLKIQVMPSRDWRSDWLYCWETDYIIYIKSLGTWIPVLDIENRTAGIWNTPFKYTAHGDSPSLYELRVIAQQELREIMPQSPVYLWDSPRPQSRWRPPPLATPIPIPSAPTVLNETTQAPDPPALRQPTPDPVSPRPANTPPVPKRVATLLKNDAVANGESCPISLTPFEECEAMVVTPCYHLFEAAALECWLRTRTTCPVCKQHVAGTGAITPC